MCLYYSIIFVVKKLFMSSNGFHKKIDLHDYFVAVNILSIDERLDILNLLRRCKEFYGI